MSKHKYQIWKPQGDVDTWVVFEGGALHYIAKMQGDKVIMQGNMVDEKVYIRLIAAVDKFEELMKDNRENRYTRTAYFEM